MFKPQDLKFAKSHEWISKDGTVGISDHAQKEITDIVFVELPKAGREVKKGEAVCVVESVKAAFDIYAPVSGKISQVNDQVTKDPALVNKDAFGVGWLFKIAKSNPTEEKDLMNEPQYQESLKETAH